MAFTQELFIPSDIKKAYDNATRSMDGNPGPSYFQNRANYNIEAEFTPATRLLKGYEKITYQNNSELQLRYMVIRLYQNIFKEGGVRGREIDALDTHSGVKITSITINGKECDMGKQTCILKESQTNIYLPFNCPAQSSAEIEIGWEFFMPSKPNDRFGGYDENTFFMAYWFPQVSVFDDINGWDVLEYNGVAEFYNEFGDFDVKISVPENYIIWATGSLQNGEQVLNKKYYQRFFKAQNSNDISQIITSEDLESEKTITMEGRNSWHFKAENVSDFAFGTSSKYLWNATGMKNRSGKNILVQSAYSPNFQSFDKVTEIARWSIEELENNVVGVDYPYPSMTVFNGTGGMEYPMIINDNDGSLAEAIFLTSHEIAHTYFPFLVGTNQRRHGWLDEGLVTMLGMDVHSKRDSSLNLRESYTEFYPVIAGSQIDIPQMVNSIDISNNIFQIHEYLRPSLAFWTLRDIMGIEMFQKCIVEFIKRWEGKHPTPWDFFFTCNNVTGEDYSWFFEPWFNRYGYTDLSIQSVKFANEFIDIALENTGGMPFPSKLIISFDDGSSEEHILGGKQWCLSKNFNLSIPTKKQPEKIYLDTSGYPDCNEKNNLFEF